MNIVMSRRLLHPRVLLNWIFAVGIAALIFFASACSTPAEDNVALPPSPQPTLEPTPTTVAATPTPTAVVVLETAAVLVSGNPLPAIAVPDAAAGLQAPTASGRGPMGERVSLDQAGSGRIIGFFAHWCPHCQEELPLMAQWLQDNELPSGVEVVAVSTAADPAASNYPPSAWMEGWSGPAIMDDANMTLSTAFGVTALPAWVAVDAEGAVVYRSAGTLPIDDFAELVASVAPGASGVPGFVERAQSRVEVGEVTIEGPGLVAYALPDTTLGTQAPIANGTSFDGEPVSLGGDGVGRVIGFFANWCPHCQAEVPVVADWLTTADIPEGVEVVAVSTSTSSDDANYPPSAWFEREGWTSPILVDDAASSVAGAFGLNAFPYWVAVDANNEVVYRVAGALGPGQIEELVRAVEPGSTVEPSFIPTGLQRVDVLETQALLADPPENLVILDVRTPEEFASGHIEGAINLDFYAPDISQQLGLLDVNNHYLIYCDSGNRSGQIFQALATGGWPELTDVEGGIQAWNAEGLPLVVP